MDEKSSSPESEMGLEAQPSDPVPVGCWSSLKTRGREMATWGAAHQEWLTAGVLGLALLWCYWPTLWTMEELWSQDPQYSHGFLVPLFALAVLLLRRSEWKDRAWQPSALGLVPVAVGVFLRLASAQIDMNFLDAISLLPMLAGIVLLVGGKSMLGWTWPAIAFLAFMVPLPYAVEQTLSQPLRRLATVMSTYLLETLGYPAIAEGNVIHIEDIPLGVAEACSGLGMLMTFFALATAFAMVIKNPWPDKALLIASAIPIALLANVLRITATGSAYMMFGRELAMTIMHDVAGWLMMPLALFLLWLELLLLERLFVELEDEAPLRVAGGQ